MQSSLFLKRISHSATPPALASSGVPTLRHSDTQPLRSTNPFVSYHIPLSRVFSMDCALFPATARAQLLSFHKLAHSFYRDGGGGTPLTRTIPAISFPAPLFSQPYKLLFPQAPSIHIHTKCPGVVGLPPRFFFLGSLSVSPSQIPIPSAAPASDQSSPPATPALRKPRRPPAATTSPRLAA